MHRPPTVGKPDSGDDADVTRVYETRHSLITGYAALNGHGTVAGSRRRGRRGRVERLPWPPFGAGRAVPKDDGAQRGVFPIWQPRYAARGIATFPVRIIERENGKTDKVPATKGYLRTGIQGSAELARKFAHIDALGFACGRRNRITVLDIDTEDENVLADAQSRHGSTPLIIRTASHEMARVVQAQWRAPPHQALPRRAYRYPRGRLRRRAAEPCRKRVLRNCSGQPR